nr:PREDICTED: putative pre-mRNA-splicing factor ATP-dependent RNA helicase DHX32 [Latimeria chalumnae]|eukprot:XP_006014152.2 PREDICTED: putative pre-mRNA-splicing factor ATP-dependent RNA helicase DHX32 [Latimeria chalumnae]
MDVNIGHEVGYSVPFENCCVCETLLRYSTDDMLLREMMSDPLLERYGVIIIDEAHERTVSTDVLLGLLKEIVIQRPKLKVVIITAPHMSSKLHSFYSSASVIRVENTCSAEVVYSCTTEKDHFLPALRLLLEIHHTGEKGDIVVFLASEQEVENAYDIISQEGSVLDPELGELLPFPLYPGQNGPIHKPSETQEKGRKNYKRNVVLTTSLGEALIWMDNVKFVIDVGIEKRNVYNPRIRADSPVVRPISRSQVEMRKQVLGTIKSGKVFCLYTEEFSIKDMAAFSPPQVQESNLTTIVLFLKRMAIAGMNHCDFIDSPAPEGLMQALEDLDYLAALDNDGNLSEIGIIMSEFPLDPQMAKAILASCEFDCVNEMLTLAAMLTGI